MAINLTKGGRIDLAKEDPGLNRVRVGLSWDINRTDTGAAFDLDVSAFGLKPDASGAPKLVGQDADFLVFYNNKQSVDGAIVHTGDNRTGDGQGDDESVTIDLTKLNPEVDEISFIVTIHDAANRRQNFGQVPRSSIRVYNDETGVKIAEYNLEEDFSSETAVQFGSLYKKDGGRVSAFKAVGAGYKAGLDAFVREYGGQV